MIPMLVIPAIDLIAGKCVRLYQGDYQRQATYDADPVVQARTLADAGFRRLHVIDLEGAREGSGRNRETIGNIVRSVPLPVQVGGGIRTDSDLRELVELGAQYLIVGTVALENPALLEGWTEAWGPHRFIVSLDLKSGRLRSHGWIRASEAALEDVIQRVLRAGVRQIICTDIERDGSLEQPGYSTLERILGLLPPECTLIAAGGVTRPGQIERLKKLGVGGAVVGRAIYEGTVRLEEFASAG